MARSITHVASRTRAVYCTICASQHGVRKSRRHEEHKTTRCLPVRAQEMSSILRDAEHVALYPRALNLKVIPVTAMVLRPHFNDMEYKLRPGMITLTWTSMNIDTYKGQVRVLAR